MKLTTAFMRAVEWRVVAILVDFTVVYLFTGKLILSAGITSASAVARTVVHAFWIHKRGGD